MASGLRIDKIYVRINILLFLKNYDEALINLYKLFYSNECDMNNIIEIISRGNVSAINIDLRDIRVKIFLAFEIARISQLAGHTENSIKWFELLFGMIKEFGFTKLPKGFRKKIIKTIYKTKDTIIINNFNKVIENMG